MKKAFVVELILAVLILVGCEDAKKKELEKDYTDMVTETFLLNKDIASRDQYIDQIMKTVNQIYVDLERAKLKEEGIVRKAKDAEGKPRLTQDQIRQAVLDQLLVVRSNLKENGKKIIDLQQKLNASEIKYASLGELIENLRASVLQREASIASLQTQIGSLEGTVAEKTREIGEKDAVIVAKDSAITGQKDRINTVYYVAGTKDDLRKKGIISEEGGFLWGLLGSTTVISAEADSSEFKPIDFTKNPAIHVEGKVAEILPRRSPGSFQLARMGTGESYVMIKQPRTFWREKYLVIILD
jgi:hypothetical protein